MYPGTEKSPGLHVDFQGGTTLILGANGLGKTTLITMLLLLHYVTFYFEDRRALVWDPTAQRQILRMLFLPARDSGRWADLEADVLQRDSNMRNLQASLTMAEREMLRSEKAVSASPEVR